MNKKTLSEQEIRTQFITPAIQQAGWSPEQIREEWTFTQGRLIIRGKVAMRGKPKRADYVLHYRPNLPLAIVEAKDNTHEVGAGMQQALEYAEILDIPFVFSSNGDGFIFHDRTGQSSVRERWLALTEFPSPKELWTRYRAARGWTATVESAVLQPYGGTKEPRYYQRVAVNRAVEAIARGQKRVLLVMATGTGKTQTAFQIIWRLRQSGLVHRVLFLADRNVLVDQTMVNDFRPFQGVMAKLNTGTGTIARETMAERERRVDTAYEVYLALYQSLTGPEDRQKVYRELSPGFFDLVIIDECHRGSAAEDSAWREILEYFTEATQIGLTATPKETEYVSNIQYFGDPVYTYSLKQGIDDGFLAPYKVVRVHLDVDIEGYQPRAGEHDLAGQEIAERLYTQRDFDRTLVIDKRTERVAATITQYLKDSGDRFQKTIIFCVDTDHAERMRRALVNLNQDLINQYPHYIMRITGDDPDGQKQLDAFIDPESLTPVLVTTSRLLSTGVDVQTCRLIVLDREVGSMTEFKQIIGRGTRIHESSSKFYFTIMDFRGATNHFFDPDFDGPPIQVYEPHGEDPVIPPDEDYGEFEDDSSTDTGQTRYHICGGPVDVVLEQVRYLDNQGNLVTESLRDYSRRTLLKEFGSLDRFLQRWNAAARKQAVLDEIVEAGLPLDQVAEVIGKGLDPFDLVCHLAFGMPPVTRHERAQRARQAAILTQYGPQARAVLEALLQKYEDDGLIDFTDPAVLRIKPFAQMGTPVGLVKSFGGRDAFEKAVQALQKALYAEVG
ncbi:EcoAI/FtnUII family type I restriction enzme subunit R [Sulfobacillus thermosulfidooxidans]|uniref:EcoAI/FtnUII family type I restriction enzme subunit R n=1 Tax=Sulfobacillus thermosulfidooxidans TaxID=28034 RepID=UPI0006B5BA3E|nr:DEAD/DEAH box helicase family protein [Sulfobacillus thermosulfidooxidans]